jgi:hypothetical protein
MDGFVKRRIPKVTSSWFFLSTLNYDAQSTTHQNISCFAPTAHSVMPDLVEQMYSPQQIHIPPTFPFVLKEYAKAAIRTQPYDLLRWSAAYFRALAQGDEPPVKKRLEYPPVSSPSGLSPGYLKVLLKQVYNRMWDLISTLR